MKAMKGRGRSQIFGKVAQSIRYKGLGKVFRWESTVELGT